MFKQSKYSRNVKQMNCNLNISNFLVILRLYLSSQNFDWSFIQVIQFPFLVYLYLYMVCIDNKNIRKLVDIRVDSLQKSLVS